MTTTPRTVSSRTPRSFGVAVLGPIIAEFCLRLWNLSALLERPGDTALLFCARGGLRMHVAYQRFLVASGLPTSTLIAPLMVSRLVAMRAALAAPLERGDDDFGPAATATLHYEFTRLTLPVAIRALSGLDADLGAPTVSATPHAIARFLQSPAGAAAKTEIIEQAALFATHLDAARAGRSQVVLVDTGLYGTTGQLLAEAFPSLTVSTALIARTYRPLLGAPDVPAVGLSVQADGYTLGRRRTALLRYWHFVEWFLEPPLSSVKHFERTPDGVRSNLEVDGWRERVHTDDDSAWAGCIDYINALPPAPASRVVHDADRAWSAYRRAVVWPTSADAHALSVGDRSHDFGREETWSARKWRGPLAAIRGATMWREGEIAASGTVLRLPLLAAIEAAYGARRLARTVRAARHR